MMLGVHYPEQPPKLRRRLQYCCYFGHGPSPSVALPVQGACPDCVGGNIDAVTVLVGSIMVPIMVLNTLLLSWQQPVPSLEQQYCLLVHGRTTQVPRGPSLLASIKQPCQRDETSIMCSDGNMYQLRRYGGRRRLFQRYQCIHWNK